ncbi:hypothetical protein KM043_012070 [Ampulex compressa]|nr:hypothetical protein KM043_012070 [Ampulex compressa]
MQSTPAAHRTSVRAHPSAKYRIFDQAASTLPGELIRKRSALSKQHPPCSSRPPPARFSLRAGVSSARKVLEKKRLSVSWDIRPQGHRGMFDPTDYEGCFNFEGKLGLISSGFEERRRVYRGSCIVTREGISDSRERRVSTVSSRTR